MEYLIGLKFYSSDQITKKIDQFRQLHDEKYRESGGELYVPIVPPFQKMFTTKFNLNELAFELTDLIDNFFYGSSNDALQMEFNGIGFLVGNKPLITLNPIISPDMHHLQESLLFYLEEIEVKFAAKKKATNPYLLLGRSRDRNQTIEIIERAKTEFSEPFVLNIEEIVLYEKNMHHWQIKKSLKSFKSVGQFW